MTINSLEKNMHYQDRDLLNAFYFAMPNKKTKQSYVAIPDQSYVAIPDQSYVTIPDQSYVTIPDIYKYYAVHNNTIKLDDYGPPLLGTE